MRPQDVERRLLGPTQLVGVGGIERRRAGHDVVGERGRRKPERRILGCQVASGVRILESVDDDDGATRTVDSRLEQGCVTVRLLDLLRRVAAERGRAGDRCVLTAEQVLRAGLRGLRARELRTDADPIRRRRRRRLRCGRAHECNEDRCEDDQYPDAEERAGLPSVVSRSHGLSLLSFPGSGFRLAPSPRSPSSRRILLQTALDCKAQPSGRGRT